MRKKLSSSLLYKTAVGSKGKRGYFFSDWAELGFGEDGRMIDKSYSIVFWLGLVCDRFIS
jgi:hypothetical protein